MCSAAPTHNNIDGSTNLSCASILNLLFFIALTTQRKKTRLPHLYLRPHGQVNNYKATVKKKSKSKGTHDLENLQVKLVQVKPITPFSTFNQLHHIVEQRRALAVDSSNAWHSHNRLWHFCMCYVINIFVQVQKKNKTQAHMFVFDYIIYLSESFVDRPKYLSSHPHGGERLYSQIAHVRPHRIKQTKPLEPM